MDRQDQYQNFLQKLIIAAHAESDDTLLAKLNEKTDYMLENIKQHMPNREFSIINWCLCISLILMSIALTIRSGEWLWSLPIAGLLLYLIYHRIKLNQRLKSSAFTPIQANEQIDNLRYVESKVHYTIKGISIKRTRVMQSRNLLIFFFPLLMVYFFELSFGYNTLGFGLVSMLLAYLMSSYCWVFLFAEDVEELNYYETSLEQDLSHIRQRL